MSTESPTPTGTTGAASSSRRALTIAAVVFAVIATAALTWAKWWPYTGKIERVLATHTFGGTSILTDGAAAPPAPSWQSSWQFTVTYFDSVWIALSLNP